ncbi:MAG TPA: hypothetical protein VGG39_08895 [Polyangiaceae bacterium]|jgi:hypothetical protein
MASKGPEDEPSGFSDARPENPGLARAPANLARTCAPACVRVRVIDEVAAEAGDDDDLAAWIALLACVCAACGLRAVGEDGVCLRCGAFKPSAIGAAPPSPPSEVAA